MEYTKRTPEEINAGLNSVADPEVARVGAEAERPFRDLIIQQEQVIQQLETLNEGHYAEPSKEERARVSATLRTAIGQLKKVADKVGNQVVKEEEYNKWVEEKDLPENLEMQKAELEALQEKLLTILQSDFQVDSLEAGDELVKSLEHKDEHYKQGLYTSGVRPTDGHLLRVARARVTFPRMSEAFAVQMIGLGF
jgi:hypothetical protein